MFKKLVPSQTVNSIYDLDLPQLWSEGIRGIIADLDNTLVGAKTDKATPELVIWLDKAEALGFQVVIVSNNGRVRVAHFADPLSLRYVHKARKPLQRAFHRALTLMNLSVQQVIVVGDQLLTDIWGGNRMGIFTVLVNPISPGDEGIPTRINRTLSKMVSAFMNKSLTKK